MKTENHEIFSLGDLVKMKKGAFYLDSSLLIESDPGIGIITMIDSEKIEVFFSLYGKIMLEDRLIEKIVPDR